MTKLKTYAKLNAYKNYDGVYSKSIISFRKIGSPTENPVMFSYILNFSITSCLSVKRKAGQNRKNEMRHAMHAKIGGTAIFLALWSLPPWAIFIIYNC